MDPKILVKHSKFLSLVLRHRPEIAGLHLDANGWTSVDALLEGCARQGHPLSRIELEEVVKSNDKRRFSFSEDGRRIRANQGHSVPVELGHPPVPPPEILFHGTTRGRISSIRRQGLLKGKRHHVHLSPDAATAHKVGSRRGPAVVLQVLAGTMHIQGYRFYCSENGVWLCETVPPQYILFPESSDRTES